MPGNGYRVVHGEYGCRVIYGPVPIADMAALVAVWTRHEPDGEDVDTVADLQDQWLLDGKLAGALGASLVAGTLRDTTAWRTLLGIA